MSKTVFTYFTLKGIAEGNRLLLAYGGEAFDDNMIAVENWPEYKPKTLFGQLPLIELDGKTYAQNTAIARYLGKKYGLGGANLLEDLQIDMNVDFLHDLRLKAAETYYEPDKELGNKKYDEYAKTIYPFMLDKLNEIITSNGGHMALGKLTWGDFMFAGLYEYLRHILKMPDLDEKYPAFKKLFDTVYAIPKVKAYAESSPKIAMVNL